MGKDATEGTQNKKVHRPWRFCVRTDHGGECLPEIPDFMTEGDGVRNENSKQPLYDGITGEEERDSENQAEHDTHGGELPGYHAAGEKYERGGGCNRQNAAAQCVLSA